MPHPWHVLIALILAKLSYLAVPYLVPDDWAIRASMVATLAGPTIPLLMMRKWVAVPLFLGGMLNIVAGNYAGYSGVFIALDLVLLWELGRWLVEVRTWRAG